MADDDDDRARREAPVRDAVRAGDLRAAAAAAIELYGGELAGYLHAIARDDDLAAEAFATFCEDLCKGLPAFRWDASLRTWSYALARHALFRLKRSPATRRLVPLEVAPEVLERAEQIRSATVQFLRTEVKDGLRQLRDQLAPEDHELLILRIDRKLAWRDIAIALGTGDGRTPDQHAAALRKRFERLKAELRALAAERGLM